MERNREYYNDLNEWDDLYKEEYKLKIFFRRANVYFYVAAFILHVFFCSFFPTGASAGQSLTAQEGEWAMKVEFEDGGADCKITQYVSELEPYTDHLLSLWVMGVGDIHLKVTNATGKEVFFSETFEATKEWREIRAKVNPQNRTGVLLEIQDANCSESIVYVDNIFLGQEGGENRVKNGGFELMDSSWSRTGRVSRVQMSKEPEIPDLKRPMDPLPWPEDRPMLAAYCGNSTQNVIDFEHWMGRPVDAVLGYTGAADWSDWEGSIDWAIKLWRKLDRPVLWSIPLIPWSDREAQVTGPNSNLADAAKGLYNYRYKKAAEKLAQFRPQDPVIYIRTAWEFNGDWFPWSVVAKEGEDQEQKIQDFIGAWRQFVTTFRSVSDRFRFDWSPNIGTPPMHPESCYPGDEYVDVIGIDIYDGTRWSPIFDPVERFQFHLAKPGGLIWHRDFARAHGKPMSFSEWGVGGNDSGDNPVQIEMMYRWIKANDVVYQTYWNSNAAYPGQLDDGQLPLSGAKYKELFVPISADAGQNAPGNVIMAITSPQIWNEWQSVGTIEVFPHEVKGIAMDPDGNQFVKEVKVTIQNAGGQYLNVQTGEFVDEVLYNEAAYNREDGYWSVDLSHLMLPKGQYSIKAYADDGGENTTALARFTTEKDKEIKPEEEPVEEPSEPSDPGEPVEEEPIEEPAENEAEKEQEERAAEGGQPSEEEGHGGGLFIVIGAFILVLLAVLGGFFFRKRKAQAKI